MDFSLRPYKNGIYCQAFFALECLDQKLQILLLTYSELYVLHRMFILDLAVFAWVACFAHPFLWCALPLG